MTKTSQELTWLEKSFAFYASYHDNPTNQLIHIICVWPILWTAFLFLSYTSPLLDQQVLGYDVNWCFIFAAAYCAYYAVIELPGVVGPLAAVMAAGSFVTVNMVKDTYQDQDPWKVGLAVHVVCWVAQFYGHGVHEKRAPALFDNLFQAFIMAPLFVLMEVFFKLGYKRAFHQRINVIVAENKKKFAEQSKKA